MAVSLATVAAVFITWISAAAQSGAAFTAQEKAWIAGHPVIRIQMSPEAPPFEFYKNKIWQGLAYDYLGEILSVSGLKFEVVDITWENALESIQTDKKIDLLLCVTSSPERRRQMLLTETYLSFPNVIIQRKDSKPMKTISDMRSASVSVEKAYVMEEWLKRDLPYATIKSYESSEQAIKAVSSSSADVYIGNLAVASYFIETNGLVNLKVVAESEYGTDKYVFGVRSDYVMLVSILNKSIKAVDQQALLKIRNKWIKIKYEYGITPMQVVLVSLALILLALSVIIPLAVSGKRKTQKIQTQRIQQAAIFALLPEAGVLSVFSDGRILDYNGSFSGLFRTGNTPIKGRASAGDLNFWLSVAQHEEMKSKLQKSGVLRDESVVFRRMDNTTFRALYSAALLKDEEGDKIIMIIKDDTDRYNAEMAVLKEKFFVDEIMKSLPGLFYIFDGQGKMMRWNKQVETSLGYSPVQLVGKNVGDFFEGGDKETVLKAVEDVFREGTLTIEASMKNSEGKFIPYMFAVSALEIGGKKYFYGFAIDITKQNEAKQELKELNMMKMNFISMITHELRTPLIVIRGFIEMMQAESSVAGNPSLTTALDEIKENADRQWNVIKELIELAGMEAGNIVIEKERADFVQVVERELKNAEFMAARMDRPVEFIRRYDAQKAEFVFDAKRISSAVFGVLNTVMWLSEGSRSLTVNAAKTERGSLPEYASQKFTRKDSDTFLVFSAVLSGFNADKNILKWVFEPFYVPGIESKMASKGMGTSLVLAKKIIDAHGGVIFAGNSGDNFLIGFTIPEGEGG